MTIKEEYDRLKSFAGQGIHFFQLEKEILPCMEFIAEHLSSNSCIHFMEIGLAFGGNFVFLGNCLNNMKPDATFGYAVDLPTKKRWKNLDFGLEESVTILTPTFPYFLHIGESRSRPTYNEIEKALKGNKLDLLFIDGDHTYGGCKGDFRLYKQLVRPGGLIAFHDIRGTKKGAFKVWKFWGEIKDKYTHKEFVTRKEDNGIGILVNK